MKSFVIATTLLVSSSWATRYNDVIYVDVIDVQPIVETIAKPERREICHRISDREQQRNHKKSGSVLGGIIGGAIGNKFGRGSGRDAATIAGVMIGSSIGSQNSSRKSQTRRLRNIETRCYIDTIYTEEEQLVGFDVSYRYNGELRYVQMEDHPGEQIKLMLNVSVIE